ELPRPALRADGARWVRAPAPPIRLVLGDAGERAAQHLLHRCEIVLSGHSLYLELAVIGPFRQAVLEYDHRADLVHRPEVRYVVALDPERGEGQPEGFTELRERTRAGSEVGRPLELVAHEGVLRVLGDHLEQA